MKNISYHLASLAITAWVGSLWAISYLAAPVLFYMQPDKELAGRLAGHMFSATHDIGLVCGVYLLAYLLWRFKWAAARQPMFLASSLMLLLTLIMLFYFEPVMNGLKAEALPLDVMHSAYGARFRMLHGISQLLALVESLLGAYLVIKNRPPNTLQEKFV